MDEERDERKERYNKSSRPAHVYGERKLVKTPVRIK